jgi:hypothetical protein
MDALVETATSTSVTANQRGIGCRPTFQSGVRLCVALFYTDEALEKAERQYDCFYDASLRGDEKQHP